MEWVSDFQRQVSMSILSPLLLISQSGPNPTCGSTLKSMEVHAETQQILEEM